jgi:hypothetical protein
MATGAVALAHIVAGAVDCSIESPSIESPEVPRKLKFLPILRRARMENSNAKPY